MLVTGPIRYLLLVASLELSDSLLFVLPTPGPSLLAGRGEFTIERYY